MAPNVFCNGPRSPCWQLLGSNSGLCPALTTHFHSTHYPGRDLSYILIPPLVTVQPRDAIWVVKWKYVVKYLVYWGRCYVACVKLFRIYVRVLCCLLYFLSFSIANSINWFHLFHFRHFTFLSASFCKNVFKLDMPEPCLKLPAFQNRSSFMLTKAAVYTRFVQAHTPTTLYTCTVTAELSQSVYLHFRNLFLLCLHVRRLHVITVTKYNCCGHWCRIWIGCSYARMT